MTTQQVGGGVRLNRWWYVVTGFLTLLFGTTTVNVLFNVLGGPMAKELGWERSVISNGLSLQTVFVGLSIVVLGILVDRFGPSAPSIPMAVLFGVSLAAMSAMPSSTLLFYVLCAVCGAGAGAVNPIAHAAVVSAWFAERRGLALGILMAGLGACGVLMPYLAEAVLEIAGWRAAFLVIGLVCTVIPTVVYLFVTRMPQEHEEQRRAARREGKVVGESLLHIARTSRQFWLLALAIFLVSSATFGLLAQIVPMTTDKGIPRGTAVVVLSAVSLASIAARLLVGYLLDRLNARLLAAVVFALCGIGVIPLILSGDVTWIVVGALLVGLGLGSEGDIGAYMVSRYFPEHSYGRVLGFVYLLYAQGAAAGIFVLGQARQASGSYASGAVPVAIMVAVAIGCLLAMGRYRYGLDRSPLSDERGHDLQVDEDASGRDLAAT